MRERLSLLLTLAGALSSVLAGPSVSGEPRPPAWVKWDRETDRVVSHTDVAAAYPRARKLTNGEILLAYHHGGGHGEYGTRVSLRRSRDGGRTWHATIEIEGPEGDAFWGFSNPDFIELGDGRVLLVTAARGRAGPNEIANERDRFLAECARSGLRLRTSEDFGQTWSAPRPLAAGRGRLWEPAIARLPDGELQIYFANEAPDLARDGRRDQRIEMARSRDGGRTWSEPIEVSQHPGCRNGMPSAIVLPGGRVACAQEMVGAPLSPWITVWEAGRRIDEFVAQRSHGFGAAPFLLRLPNGGILLSFHSGFQKEPAPADASLPWMFSTVWVQRGNSEARDFAEASQPWPHLDARTGAFFASLLLKDDRTLVALASLRSLESDGTSRTRIRWIEGRLLNPVTGP